MRKTFTIGFAAGAHLLGGCASNYVYKIADDRYKMECRENMEKCEDEARKVCPGPFSFEEKKERKQTLYMQDGSIRESVIYNVIIKCN
jgi:hypothetical protein